MNHMDTLAGRGAAAPDPVDQVEPCMVANTPGTLDDDVFVTLDNFDKFLRVGPVKGWKNTDPSMWPAQGDEAVVVRVDQGDYWFVGWEPS